MRLCALLSSLAAQLATKRVRRSACSGIDAHEDLQTDVEGRVTPPAVNVFTQATRTVASISSPSGVNKVRSSMSPTFGIFFTSLKTRTPPLPKSMKHKAGDASNRASFQSAGARKRG